MNEVKGKNALALSRDLGMSHKACWIMLHKLREAMAAEFKGRKIGGEGKVAEMDGAYFGGYVRPANYAEHRRDRRLAVNQSGKRQSLVVLRERGGNTLPMTFKSEGAALAWARQRIQPGTIVNADEASSWDALNDRFEMRRINHSECYSDGEACTNWAESYFSRIRRAEIGHHHHVSGPYFCAMDRKARGVRMHGALITAHKFAASRLHCRASRQWISAATISGMFHEKRTPSRWRAGLLRYGDGGIKDSPLACVDALTEYLHSVRSAALLQINFRHKDSVIHGVRTGGRGSCAELKIEATV
jgi:hypothetical protein